MRCEQTLALLHAVLPSWTRQVRRMRRVHAEFGTKRYYRKKDAGSLESSHILPKCLGRSSGKRSSSTTSATRRSRSFARPRAKRAAGVSEYLACVSKFWERHSVKWQRPPRHQKMWWPDMPCRQGDGSDFPAFSGLPAMRTDVAFNG